MDEELRLVKKADKNYRVQRPSQTGFSSPATHYNEPRIDLNETLVSNSSATFFVRVADDSFQTFGIAKNDVLIVDKSLVPKPEQLILASMDDAFHIMRVGKAGDPLNLWGVITYIIKSVI
ncbi:S24 family peptidase [Maribacter confluentis]|uniref:S24 family peptidase n=1 Tax=Maribacter confluentis TaxID=1656093 RepID=A0ABT8RUE8_9FLAO|nr:S24 family peptidase [Maribacter confluentis]MDO1514536.1 S24 family peptidase [Maribacter confluentis]